MVGDPLDQKLFAATQWVMEDEAEHAYEEEDHPHQAPSSSITTLLTSALNRNIEGLQTVAPHEKGDMAESWGEFGAHGRVIVSPNAVPHAAHGHVDEHLTLPTSSHSQPIAIEPAVSSAAATGEGSVPRATPGSARKQVTSVVLPIKPASSWPGFKDLSALSQSADDTNGGKLSSAKEDGSEHGATAPAKSPVALPPSGPKVPGHVAVNVIPAPEEARFLLLRRFEFSSEKARMVRLPYTNYLSSLPLPFLPSPPLQNLLQSTCTCESNIQGVLAKHPNGSLVMYVKGAPEVIKNLVDPSTLPSDFDGELAQYTREGLRVLGLASRDISNMTESEAMAATQEQLERNLIFMGFAVMINRLKSDTADVIGHLQAANMRCAMITGDHIVTGVSIARQCNILDARKTCAVVDRAKDCDPAAPVMSFSFLMPDGAFVPQPDSVLPQLMAQVESGEIECGITGHGFTALQLLAGPKIADDDDEEGDSPVGHMTVDGVRYDVEVGGPASMSPQQMTMRALRKLVLTRCGVFARMSPEGKKAVVDCMGPGYADHNGNQVKGLGHYVGFCGDGANDLAVLKTALVGVSLCDADASVAAPLTSKNQSISCVVDVVAEGRCSLITAYNIFQFVMVYAFVQVFAANLMYTNGLVVGNYQYLIQVRAG